jgi:hypothetical protein
VFTRTYTLAPQLQRAAALNTEAKYEVRVQQAGAATLATVLKWPLMAPFSPWMMRKLYGSIKDDREQGYPPSLS